MSMWTYITENLIYQVWQNRKIYQLISKITLKTTKWLHLTTHDLQEITIITMSWRVIPRIYTLFSSLFPVLMYKLNSTYILLFRIALAFRLTQVLYFQNFWKLNVHLFDCSYPWILEVTEKLCFVPWEEQKKISARGLNRIALMWLSISETNLPNNRQLLEILCRHWKV